MEVILHAHHADVSALLQEQAEAAIRRAVRRLHRVASATIRFVGDGGVRRVEIIVSGARKRVLFAHAEAREFATALVTAIHRLQSQVARTRIRRLRKAPPTGAHLR